MYLLQSFEAAPDGDGAHLQVRTLEIRGQDLSHNGKMITQKGHTNSPTDEA